MYDTTSIWDTNKCTCHHLPKVNLVGRPWAETGDDNQADAIRRVQACKVSNRLVAFSLVEDDDDEKARG